MIDRKELAPVVNVSLKAKCSGCSCVAPIYSEDEHNFRYCRDCTIAGYTAARVLVAPRFLEVRFV